MNLFSYVAFLSVLEGLVLPLVILFRSTRSPSRWGFVAMGLATVFHAGCWVVVLGADDPVLAALGQGLADQGAVVVGLACGAVATLLGIEAQATRAERSTLFKMAGALAGWGVLLWLVPWGASGLLLVVVFFLVYRPDPLSQWHQHLPRAVAEAVVFVDRYHRVTGANPAALRQYPGLAPGQDFFFLFDEASTLVTQWSHAEARTSRVEPLSLHVSGVAVSVSVAPHYDRFGDFVGAVALVSEGRQSDWEARCASLSPREREVVDLIVQGLSNQDIADRLFLSLGTVKRHVHEVLAKMNVARREELKVLQTGGTT